MDSRIRRALARTDLRWAAAPIVRDAWEPHAARLDAWIRDGRHGTMDWLRTSIASRMRPWEGREWARSWISVLLPAKLAPELPRGTAPVVAGYACDRDYHHRADGILAGMRGSLEAEFPGMRSFPFCDDQALPEVELAVRAGLGWRGRNSLLLTAEGSAFHVAGLLTDLEGVSAPPPHPDRCGNCRACVDACPSEAVSETRSVDARRCIAHWNIEDRATSEGPAARASRGEIFGCDLCQSACPWNRKAPCPPEPPAGHPRTWEDWVRTTAPGGGFQSIFGRTPLRRAGRHKVRKVVIRSLLNVDPDEARIQAGQALLDEGNRELRRWLREARERAPGDRPRDAGIFAPTPAGGPGPFARALVGSGLGVASADPPAGRCGQDPSLPRVVLLEEESGPGFEGAISRLGPVLERGDIVVDCGDRPWSETVDACRELSERGIRLLDVAARANPGDGAGGLRIAASGDRSAWREVEPILSRIARRSGPDGATDLCAWTGPLGTARFSGCVHDAVVGAELRLVDEARSILGRNLLPPSGRAEAAELALRASGPEGRLLRLATAEPPVEASPEAAAARSRGASAALECARLRGVPVPTLRAAADPAPIPRPAPQGATDRTGSDRLVESLGKALAAARARAWADGFRILSAMALHQGWRTDPARLALVWSDDDPQEGIPLAFRRDPGLQELLLDRSQLRLVEEGARAFRELLAESAEPASGTPVLRTLLSPQDLAPRPSGDPTR